MSPSRTSSLRTAAVAVLALGAGGLTTAATPASAATATLAPAPASSGPATVGSVSGAGGCAQNCIKSAMITPTVGSAKIAVETYGPATIGVTVRRPSDDARPGPLVFSQTSAPAQTAFAPTAEPLQPDTTYEVTVTTKDSGGVLQHRTGTFHTLQAVPLVEPAADEKVGPVEPGCSVECITGSSATANLTTVSLTVDTRVPATLVVTAARTAPQPTSQGPMFTAPEKTIHTIQDTHWKGGLSKLKENAKYFVVFARPTRRAARASARAASAP